LRAAGWALGAIAVCLLLAATFLLTRGLGEMAALGQESTTPATTTPPSMAPPSTAPPSSAPAAPASVPSLFPELTQAFSPASAAPQPRGIPGLGVTDVLGELYRFPVDGRFYCRGPVPAEEAGLNLWICSAPSARAPASHEVMVVGDDPLTVLSVRATVRGVSEEEAAKFFGYVGSLCLGQQSDPFDPVAWMEANAASGGQVFAGGAEFTVYGTKEQRTMQIVAADSF